MMITISKKNYNRHEVYEQKSVINEKQFEFIIFTVHMMDTKRDGKVKLKGLKNGNIKKVIIMNRRNIFQIFSP